MTNNDTNLFTEVGIHIFSAAVQKMKFRKRIILSGKGFGNQTCVYGLSISAVKCGC